MLLLKIYTEEEIKWLEDFARKNGGDPTKIRKHLEELNRQELQRNPPPRTDIEYGSLDPLGGKGPDVVPTPQETERMRANPWGTAAPPSLSEATPGFRGNAPAPSASRVIGPMQLPPRPPAPGAEGVKPPPNGPPAVSTAPAGDAGVATGTTAGAGAAPSAATTPPPGPRFKPGEAPALDPYTPGARPDYSAQEARLSEIGAPLKGLAGFGEGFARGLLPRYAEMQEHDEDEKRALAERALMRERETADRDFESQEALKRGMYLSDYQTRQGKQYYTDTKTGVSGWYAPTEIATIQASEERMQLERQKLDIELQQMERTGRLAAAQIDYYRALADKANTADEMQAVIRMAINETAKVEEQGRVAGNPLAPPIDTSGLDAVTAELARRAGVSWPPPGAGAAAAAPPPYQPPTAITPEAVDSLVQGAIVNGATAQERRNMERIVQTLPEPHKSRLMGELNKVRIH